jgi:hypothetical protein
MNIQITVKDGFLLPDKVNIPDGIYIVSPRRMTLSVRQNRALHKYFTCLSEALNGAGYTVQNTLKLEADWTAGAVKDLIWKPYQKALTNKLSTAELGVDEVNIVYENLHRYLSTKYGIEVPFPTTEE